ncbi:metallophosphoesterase family protein [Sorangium sp. So ce854]|uniref:metallophosphoesterase family protein n=1 Tax=Sorangium sp. So ce854 TaxID=3133322 RepID=UPI003F6229B0
MTKLFSWIHISDIHIGHGSADHRWDQRLVLEELKADIKRISADSRSMWRPLDAIFVTGDVAFSGDVLGNEYAGARSLLTEIAGLVGLSTDQVFIVPGNHDVQRTTKKDEETFRLVKSLRRKKKLDDALARPGDRSKLERRFANYRKFASGFASPCQDLFWVHTLPLLECGLRVRVVGLNTAILCNDDKDRGALELGKEQIHKALVPTPDENELVIVMSHHPLRDGWLADEKMALRWIQNRAHVHLSGHLHEASNQRIFDGGGGGLVEVAAGAAHAEKGHLPTGHGYCFGAVVASGKHLRLRVWPRVWSAQQSAFRKDVNSVTERRHYAEHVLRLKRDRGEPSSALDTLQPTPETEEHVSSHANAGALAPVLEIPSSVASADELRRATLAAIDKLSATGLDGESRDVNRFWNALPLAALTLAQVKREANPSPEVWSRVAVEVLRALLYALLGPELMAPDTRFGVPAACFYFYDRKERRSGIIVLWVKVVALGGGDLSKEIERGLVELDGQVVCIGGVSGALALIDINRPASEEPTCVYGNLGEPVTLV